MHSNCPNAPMHSLYVTRCFISTKIAKSFSSAIKPQTPLIFEHPIPPQGLMTGPLHTSRWGSLPLAGHPSLYHPVNHQR